MWPKSNNEYYVYAHEVVYKDDIQAVIYRIHLYRAKNCLKHGIYHKYCVFGETLLVEYVSHLHVYALKCSEKLTVFYVYTF